LPDYPASPARPWIHDVTVVPLSVVGSGSTADPGAPLQEVGDGIAVHEVSGPALTGSAACLPAMPGCKRG
jgi:hypothetical protein